MLIKPLKQLFAANSLNGLLPVLYTGQVGVGVGAHMPGQMTAKGVIDSTYVML